MLRSLRNQPRNDWKTNPDVERITETQRRQWLSAVPSVHELELTPEILKKKLEPNPPKQDKLPATSFFFSAFPRLSFPWF